MGKAKAAIVSSTPDTASSTARQLRAIFDGLAVFEYFDFQTLEKTGAVVDADLVLVTSKHIARQAREYIRPPAETITAARTINVDTIHELYELAENARVLLVNNVEETTFEAIRQLQAVGFDHLRYFPYYPGIPRYQADCPYVVSFDEVDLIPKGAYTKIINLGSRPVDLVTIIDLATRLGLYDRLKDVLSATFLKSSLNMAQNIYRQLQTNRYLREKQTFILNMFEAGVLALNADNKIDYYNSKAEKILKLTNGSSTYLDAIIKKSKYDHKFFITIDKKNYYTEINKYKNKKFTESIIVIDGANKIESIEKDYRIYTHQKGFVADYTFENIFHESAAMKKTVLKARQFAKSDSSILIEGESGSGKEMFAQAIHNESSRRRHPFVAVNFAALNEALCESELFGYVEGSFTGARKGGKKGLFETAHKGTIFLDEIGDAPVTIQKKILRVLQERRIMPVGSNQLIPVDVRVIAATNQNLWDMVQQKTFRQDLYYRLKVLPLSLPALRDRPDDIIPSFAHFLRHVFSVNARALRDATASREVAGILTAHQWPGNVRELRNVAEYVSNCIALEMDWIPELEVILHGGGRKDTPPPDLAELEQYGPAEDMLRLLRALNRPPYVFGRRELEGALPPLSQSVIKKYLAGLKKSGFIQSRTGYGSYLLEAGKRLCAAVW